MALSSPHTYSEKVGVSIKEVVYILCATIAIQLSWTKKRKKKYQQQWSKNIAVK